MEHNLSLRPLNTTGGMQQVAAPSNQALQALAAKRDAAVMSPIPSQPTDKLAQNPPSSAVLQQSVWGKSSLHPPSELATLSVAGAVGKAFTLGNLIKTYDDNLAKRQQQLSLATTKTEKHALGNQITSSQDNAKVPTPATTALPAKGQFNPASPLADKVALKELLSNAKDGSFITDKESKELAKLFLKKEGNKLTRLFSKLFNIQPKVDTRILSKERLRGLAQTSFIDQGATNAQHDFALGKKVSLNGKKFVVYIDTENTLHLVKQAKTLGKGSFGKATEIRSFTGHTTSPSYVMKTAHTKVGDDYHKTFALSASRDLFAEASNIGYLHSHGPAVDGKLIGIQDKPHKVLQYTSAQGKEKVAHLGALYNGMCEGRTFEGEEARSAVWQTFTGLQTMQRLDMHHGDIKPGNLFFRTAEAKTDALEVHIADFGGARQLVNTETAKYSAFHGTPGYKPPGEYLTKEELFSGDVYALSLSCCEMILGEDIGKRLFDVENSYSKGLDSEHEPAIAKEYENQLVAKGLSSATAQLLIKGLSSDWTRRPSPQEVCNTFS